MLHDTFNMCCTSIVIFQVTGGRVAADVASRLKARGILMSAIANNSIRLVTHLDVDRGACLTAAEALAEVMEEVGSSLQNAAGIAQ